MNKVCIVIPAFEPDNRMIELLSDLDKNAIGPVVIVNDGSGKEYDVIFDKALSIIKKSGGTVITHKTNKGKGRALKTAFAYILDHYENITAVITADSDGQHTAECIKRVIDAVENNEQCLILGVRKFDLEGIPWKSRFGNTLTEKVFQYVAGIHVSDTQTGLRGIPKGYLKELISLKGERFEYEMRMLLDVAEKGISIVEVPIQTIYESEDNHQTHFNPIKDSVKIYKILGGKFLKYIFSSFSSSILDLAMFSLICIGIRHLYPVGYITIATIAARVVSATYNYIINYKVVFKSKADISHAAFKYFILAILQMGCSAVMVTALVQVFPFFPEILWKIIVDTLLFFISYHIQQHFVFKNRL